jgi:F-type H+-transporting ATPase subunit k
MGAAYTILGKQVPSHILALATLASVGAVIAWPRSKTAPAPVEATSAVKSKEDDFDLEKFINDLGKEESK